MSVSLIDGHIDDDVMTDEQIIKALEHCVTDLDCLQCPYVDYDGKERCDEKLLNDLCDLINRQKAEIERLEKDSKRLKKVQMQLDDAMKMYTTIKAEAIKEFAERLHCHCQSIINEEWNKKVYPNSWADAYEEFDEVVDNLVKEMVGEASG